jgi:hypothetical protein
MLCASNQSCLRSNIWLGIAALLGASLLATGCGTTKARLATEQLIVSEAVDQAVSEIDFRPLAGTNVHLDTRYIKNIKGLGFVNADYIVSSLRQQIIAADCRLQQEPEDADFIIEARVGTLGTNGHEIVYGMPANNALSSMASLVPNTPALPAVPEISIARKDAHLGAAKLAVFAYERETGRPIWQSGISQARSTAQDVWVFGAGPFQRGSIYEGTQFAGSELRVPTVNEQDESHDRPAVALQEQFHFPRRLPFAPPADVQVVGFEEEIPKQTDVQGQLYSDGAASEPPVSERAKQYGQ